MRPRVAKNFVVEAGDSVTIKTGDASITMQKDGTISITGKDITIEGRGKINVSASGDVVVKGQQVGSRDARQNSRPEILRARRAVFPRRRRSGI